LAERRSVLRYAFRCLKYQRTLTIQSDIWLRPSGLDWRLLQPISIVHIANDPSPGDSEMQRLLRKHRLGGSRAPRQSWCWQGIWEGPRRISPLPGPKNRQVGLIASFHFQTQASEDLYPPLTEVTACGEKKHGIRVEHGALGAAGPIRGRIVKLTHASLSIHSSSLRRRLGLKTLLLASDFDAIGHGVNFPRRGDCCL
jgi:hypothetical protein